MARKSKKSSTRSKTKKARREKKRQQALERKAKKLEKQAEKKLKKINRNVSYAKRYESTKDLPQYSTPRQRIENAKQFLKDNDKVSKDSLHTIARLAAKGWTQDKAQGLYDLVTTDVYSIFRQKYKPPSDYYDVLFDDFSAQDIERAMDTLNKDSTLKQGDYKSSEIINVLYDMLVDTL